MHAGLQDYIDKRVKSKGGTQTIVNSKSSTLAGSLDSNGLEDLIRIAAAHNSKVELVAGVLTVTSG